MTDKNNESALLLRMNKEEQVSVLQEIGFTSVNENTPASDIAKYIRWAGGLLDLSFATIRIEDGVNVFFTAEEWNSLSANNRSKYLRIGVRIRADRRQFVIAKSDCTDDIGGRTFKWGAYGTDIRGVKNYGNGNQGLYETADGKQNTDAIIEATAGVKDNSGVVGAPAAEAAKSYKACTLELDGLEDKTEWYLPSEGELIIIAKYKTEINELWKTEFIREKTGLIIDAYFSATKVKWILDHVEGAREKAEAGKLIFGTVDSWLVWKLTRGEVHVTDVTNASRTMLYNIHRLAWDPELLELFGIPAAMLPEVKTSSEIYGHTKTTLFAHKIPIAGIAGDQQAALFGQMCTEPGMVKNTYGTGCFLLMNSGDKPVVSKNNLLATIAWKIGEEVTYALEGSIFVGGAIVQWLRDGLGIIRSSGEVETLAHSVPDAGGVYFVPALTGLAAPYWNQDVRGAISGISRGTTAAHIARAALEGIAFQTMDVVNAMIRDAGIELKELRVDGGAAANNVLMQFQADILNTTVIRPKIIETTALGAAYLAGLAVGYWSDIHEIHQHWHKEKEFIPSGEQQKMEELKEGWRDAVDRVLER